MGDDDLFEPLLPQLETSTDSNPDSLKIQSQVAVLLFAYFAETVIATFKSPFLPKLVRGLDIVNGEERKVGYYLGALQSASALTTAISVLVWGSISDHRGRKSTMILCSIGMASAAFLFGYGSTSFNWFIGCQILEGLFRASKPTVKTALSEVAAFDTVGTQLLAKLLSFMPPVYAAASSLAPLVAGLTVSRLEQVKYPYLVPCTIAAAVCIVASIMVTTLFKETLSPKLSLLDISRTFQDESESNSQRGNSDIHANTSLRSFLTRPIITCLLIYAIFSFLDISFNSVFILFLASPIEAGGLNFPPSTIGIILGCGGAFHALFQTLMFARIYARWDRWTIYVFCTGINIVIYLMMPLMNAIARRDGLVSPLVWMLLIFEELLCTAAYSGFSVMYIYITLAAPSPSALGRMHGAAQTMYSLMSATGPAFATSLVAWFTVRHNYTGAYFIMAFVALVSVGTAQWLPRGRVENRQNVLSI